MTCRCRPLNSSRHTSQRLTCQERRMRPRSSCSRPRLPIIVPRSGTATISPNGVTRFCLGIERPPPKRLRPVPSLLLGADLPPPAQPPGRTCLALDPDMILLGDGTPEVVQQRLALEADLAGARAVVALGVALA